MRREINFDRFVRGLLMVLGVAAAYLALTYLSPVLLPFFAAWVLAYILYPVVRFLETKCRLRNRTVCIFLTVALVAGAVAAAAAIIVPPFVSEVSNFRDVAEHYIANESKHADSLPSTLEAFVRKHADELNVKEILQQKDVQAALRKAVPQVWNFFLSTASTIVSLLSSLIALLYFFFLLKDYESYAEGWISYVPRRRRKLARQVVADVERGMNGYFRGQVLVALSNCVMFSAGFLLIGFPMPVALGCFIGIISFVPYLQLIGFIPAAILALLRAAEYGENFWVLMLLVVAVYVVVQIIQDSVVTPHVMGKITGLSPAIVLLALTVWGYALGVLGLIVALPMTTLLISYYKRYVIGEPAETQQEIPATPLPEGKNA